MGFKKDDKCRCKECKDDSSILHDIWKCGKCGHKSVRNPCTKCGHYALK